jgi:putative endonuclease
MNQKQLGTFGEKIALNYLKNKGYQILDKNYSPKFISGPQRGEIDIVSKKDNIISFIEVKTLTGNNRGRTPVISPEEKVDYLKQRKIIKTAQSWLMEKKVPLDSKWQIDIISIKIDLNTKEAKIRHFQNAIF